MTFVKFFVFKNYMASQPLDGTLGTEVLLEPFEMGVVKISRRSRSQGKGGDRDASCFQEMTENFNLTHLFR